MRLYKYLHPDRIDVLENERICFATPIQLNDPFEFQTPIDPSPALDISLSVCDHPMAADPKYDLPYPASATEKHIHISKKALEELPSPGILCLTERRDNLTMWSHYADSHKGFVLEFDPEHAFLNLKTNKNGTSSKVHYSKTRPLFYVGMLPPEIHACLFYTKSEHWSYEQEWRVFKPLNDADCLDEKTNQFHLFSYPGQCLKSVIIGVKSSSELKHRIAEALGRMELRPDFECYEAELDSYAFKLNFKKVCMTTWQINADSHAKKKPA